MKINIKNKRIYKKAMVTSLTFGIILTSMPTYSLASENDNKYYNEISSIQIKEDLQKSAQKAVAFGEVDTWIEGLTSMPTKRSGLTSAVVDGKIYCIGGYDDIYYLNTVEVYDPETNSWETKTSMPTKRSGLTSAVVDGKIYCIGGTTTSYTLSTVEMYDPETNSWETKTPMPNIRSGLTSVVVDGKIYCIGGVIGSSYYNSVEVYDPVTNSWETKTSMPTKRGGLISAVVDDKIYCIGGNTSFSTSNIVEVYDPATDSWETKTSMPTGRAYFTSAVVDGKIYCIGGVARFVLNTVEVYDPVTNSWETKTPMPTKRNHLISAVVDGEIYCIGGTDDSYSNLNIVEAYIAITPKTESEKAEEAVEKAEVSRNLKDIEDARNLVNKLPESEAKDDLQNRLDIVIPNISLERKTSTSNLDVYIKSENSLHMALSTNNITFEDYSGVNDLEKQGAINITINSSLPYQLNAYMLDEMYNSDKSQKMDIDRLNIRDDLNTTNTEYKEFTAVNTKLTLNDSCDAGNGIKHAIDLKLNGHEAYPADIYKATVKFEAEQK